MKWNKFDPENPPNGDAFFVLHYSCYIEYHACFYRENKLFFYEVDGMTCLDADTLEKLNAHWIYPQDLEMPE